MKKKTERYGLVGLIALLLLLTGLQQGGYQRAIPCVAAAFGLNQTEMGLLVTLQLTSSIISPVAAGLLADRFGQRRILALGIGYFLAGCLLAGLAAGLALFTLGVFLVGCGGSTMVAIGSAAISDLDEPGSNRLLNLCLFFYSVGAILGPLAVQALLRGGVSWRAFFAAVGAPMALLLIPTFRAGFPRRAAAAPKPDAPKGLRTFLRAPGYALLLGSAVLYVGIENGFGYFVASLFETELRAPAWGAFAVSAFWMGMCVSRLVNGLGARSAARMVVVHFLMATAMLTVLAVSRRAALSLAASFLIGYSYGPIWSAQVALAAAEFPGRSAGAVGILNTGCGIGGTIYPSIMGAMAGGLSIRVSFLFLGATALAGALLGLVYLRRQRAKS